MGRFDGTRVLITGAGSGMGRITALRFVEEGASVVGFDVNAAGLDETRSAASDPGRLTVRVCDVSDRSACQEAVGAAVSELGGLDVVVNVAGVLRMNHFTEVSEAELGLIFGVNVNGTFWIGQAAMPHLLESSGNLINIASNAGLMGQAYCAAYCASKAAVINLTKALAMEYAKTPVRINCVAPGGTDTPMATTTVFPDNADFKLVQPYMGFRPMADPVGVADTILFVASPEAFAVHGAVFSVDSGLTAG